MDPTSMTSIFGYVAGGLVVITLFAILGAGKSGEGATLRDRILSSPALTPLLIVHYFLPYGLTVLVLFMDIMSQLPQGVFGLAFGLVVMLFNSLIGKDASAIPNDLCEIPGFKSWSSNVMPQSLLFVSIVVTYLASFVTGSTLQQITPQTANAVMPTYNPNSTMQTVAASSLSMTPSPYARVGASWGLAVATILIQSVSLLSTPGCLSMMKTNVSFLADGLGPVLLTVLVGMGIGGGTGYALSTQSFTQPTYTVTQGPATQFVIPGTTTPSSTQARGPGFVKEQFQLGSGLGEIPAPPQPVNIAQSSNVQMPGESSDQFVCEAYKNGELVTTSLVG